MDTWTHSAKGGKEKGGRERILKEFSNENQSHSNFYIIINHYKNLKNFKGSKIYINVVNFQCFEIKCF